MKRINHKNEKVLILSFTPVSSAPRMLNQASFFLKKDIEICIAGFPGKNPLNPRWNFIDLSSTCSLTSPTLLKRIKKSTKIFGRFLKGAEFCYWKAYEFEKVLKQLQKFTPFSLIICHDYITAPIGHALSIACNIPYWVDMHEHALSEDNTHSLIEKLKWKYLNCHYVNTLQKKFVTTAPMLTTASDGFAKSFQKDYQLPNPPHTIKNVPPYTNQPFRPYKKGTQLKCLYHGYLFPNRGIEELIQSIAFCYPHINLTLQGSGKTEYIDYLKRMIKQHQVQNRVHLTSLVPFSDIVKHANTFDVGLFIPPKKGPQNTYNLSNKFFEYIMAGLVLCTRDFPEMAKIVNHYNLGVLVSSTNPQAIAQILNQLSTESINLYKQNALTAAKKLCWEEESLVFEQLYLKLTKT